MADEPVNFGFGSVQFVKAVEPVPPSERTTANVTIKDMGQPGSPEHFLVTFMLECESQSKSTRANIFHWTEVVTGLGPKTPYSEVEAQAARQLAPSLRAVADEIEKLVVEFDKKAAADKP